MGLRPSFLHTVLWLAGELHLPDSVPGTDTFCISFVAPIFTHCYDETVQWSTCSIYGLTLYVGFFTVANGEVMMAPVYLVAPGSIFRSTVV